MMRTVHTFIFNRTNTASLLVFLSLAIAHPTLAISIRHDVPESQYFDLANQFPAVGRLDDEFGALCTGTLVTPNKVLTAAHCVDGLNGPEDNQSDLTLSAASFNLGANADNPLVSRGISHVAVNTWNGQANGDMAVLTLTEPVSTIAPVPITSLDATNMLGTMVGFGLHGTGQNFNFESDGLRRAAQNTIDLVSGTVETDFDNAAGTTSSYGTTAQVGLEGSTASGDSGGPIVADFGFGAAIVGVLNSGFNPFGTESEYGDVSVWASASRQANVNFLRSNGLTVVDELVETLRGDYDGSGLVGAGDLNLVLGNWGVDGTTAPAGWVADLPNGVISAEELNVVLSEWGNSSSTAAVFAGPSDGTISTASILASHRSFPANAVPESNGILLLLACVAIAGRASRERSLA